MSRLNFAPRMTKLTKLIVQLESSSSSNTLTATSKNRMSHRRCCIANLILTHSATQFKQQPLILHVPVQLDDAQGNLSVFLDHRILTGCCWANATVWWRSMGSEPGHNMSNVSRCIPCKMCCPHAMVPEPLCCVLSELWLFNNGQQSIS